MNTTSRTVHSLQYICLKKIEQENPKALERLIAGRKYYPLFFPEQYNDYLVMKYLYEDNESREEPDYV